MGVCITDASCSNDSSIREEYVKYKIIYVQPKTTCKFWNLVDDDTFAHGQCTLLICRTSSWSAGTLPAELDIVWVLEPQLKLWY